MICYDEVSSGGYYLHADQIQIKEDIIVFGMDDKSYSPGETDVVPDVMGGFFHMAAISKEYLEGKQFKNVVYPDDASID